MKVSTLQLVFLAAVSVFTLLLFAPAADAQPAAAEQADTKVASSLVPGGNVLPVVAPRTQRIGTTDSRGAECPFPSFEEVPHGAEGLANYYSHSYYDGAGRLWDVYKFHGATIEASTRYWK